MRCQQCSAETPERLKFCNQCGSQLAASCIECGFENARGAKFCGRCSSSLTVGAADVRSRKTDVSIAEPVRVAAESCSATLDGERKTITAVFADIKGSMELIEDLDPEEARAIVDPALKLMMEAVQHYGGYVAQSTGDGIFALFGAPVAHEDHAQRALYAALRMQEDISRFAERLRAEGRPPLHVRVGANSGEVVVRTIKTGETHSEYVPIGHSTSLAARIQALAPIGSIAITGSMQKLVEGYFQLKSLGVTGVKGVSQPVNLYEVTGLGPLRTRLQRSAGRGLTKFVGRERETEALKHAAQLATQGHGQIVAAVAEPGVGKSRLLFEFKATSRSGWMVLELVSVSHGKASAYLPVIDLLRNYFDISAGDDEHKRREKVTGRVLALDRSLEDTVPYLFSLLGIVEGDDPLAQMDGQIKRRRTLDAVKRLLLRESLNQPLLVVFEDLHWIDDETQALLNLLADSIGTAKILLLVSYRPEYSHRWNSKTYYTQLRLDPLGTESADEMLQFLLGDGAGLELLKGLIVEKTEGNPLFMEETVEMLLDEGALVRNGSIKLVKPLAELKIPSSVQAILASRIDRLSPNEKDLLQTLAVIGREFAISLVRRVVTKSGEELDRMLYDLQFAEFIYEQPAAGDVEYIFKHALTQEVAYHSVLAERRKLLHERIGSALEASAQSIDDHLSQLAYHYGHSSNIEKTIEYLDRAGQQAIKRGALKEAQLYFKRAIAALSTTPETLERLTREFSLQLAVVALLATTSGYATDDTALAVRRLKELSERSGNRDQLIFMLAVTFGPLLSRGEVTAAQRIADQTLEIAELSGSNLHLTIAHQLEAQSHLRRGNLKHAMQHFEAMMASYNQHDYSGWPSDPKANALPYIGYLWWHLGMADRARANIREAISLSEHLSNPADLANALAFASRLYIDLLDSDKAQESAERLHTLARERGLSGELELSSVFRGWAVGQEGRTDEGCSLISSALDSVFARGTKLNVPQFLALLSSTQARGGQLEEALATIEKALSSVGEEEVSVLEALWRRGEIHLQQGDEAEAERDFLGTIAAALRMGSKAYQLRATTSLARLLASRGKRTEAREMLAEIYDWFTEGFDTHDLKDAKALLAELID